MSASPLLDTILQDLRCGARTLGRQPSLAAMAVLALGLGIGANAAIFSVVNTVLLRPLPWGEPDRAVMIWSKWTAFDKTWVASGEVVMYRQRSRTVTDVAAWGEAQVNLTGAGEPERVASAAVTSNTFQVLGTGPQLGRTFTAVEDLPNGPDLVVIGHDLWSRRYQADPGIIGRPIEINGRAFDVVGVMPAGFLLPTDFQNVEPSQLWTPLRMDPASTNFDSHGLYAAGRLAPNATVEQAADEFHRIARAMTDEGFLPAAMEFDTVVLSLVDEVVGPVRQAVLLLGGAVAFLLLIACANVANMLLARAEARQREMALRAALGAGRLRVVRQLLTENLILTGCAAISGLGFAYGAVRLVAWWNPANIPRVAGVTVDGQVLAFTAVVALVTSVTFGLAPAFRASRVALSDALRDGGQGGSSGPGRQRFRNALVVVQMALAVVLLVGAGLMIRSVWSLQQIPLGFEPSGVLTMRLSLPQPSYPETAQVVGFYDRLLERVRALPGVQAAGAVRALPLGSTIGDRGLQVDGYVPTPGTNAKGDWQIATAGYFEASGERIVEGRTIALGDTSESMLVAVINEEMARLYWAGRSALGGRFRIGMGPQRPWVTVVGIAADVRHNGLAAPVKEKFYVPHPQWHRSLGTPIRAMTLVIRSEGSPAALAPAIRQEVRRFDPQLPVSEVRSLDAVVSAALSSPRFTGLLLTVFAALALALSAIGVYGVLAYLVSRRTREIGIRLAIGATRGAVLRMVLGRGLMLSLVGLAIGLVVAALAARLMTGLLHGVEPGDPLTFAVVAAVLALTAVAASLAPAVRATRVNPIAALRAE